MAGTSGASGEEDRVAAAVARLRVDALGMEVVQALSADGVRAVLLKGPAIATWLYERGERTYGDVDLLVAPADFRRAHTVLVAQGFRASVDPTVRGVQGLDPGVEPWHDVAVKAVEYHRAEGGSGWVDLHQSLEWGHPAAVWNVLSEGTDRLVLAGREVEVPSQAGRALVVALHALQHSGQLGRAEPANRAVADLERAVQRASEPVWQRAAELAARLGLELQLLGGLRMVAGGPELAARLGLPGGNQVDARIEALTAMLATPQARWFERLGQARGAFARVRFVGRGLFPPRESLRAADPRADRGWLGLASAHARRLARIVAPGLSALRAWRRARRAA